MGSYGTPSLHVNPPQEQNMVGQLQGLASVQNMLQAGPQEAQLRQQQIDQNDVQMKQTQAINNAYKSAVSVDPNTGQSTIDPDQLTKTLAAAGHGSAIPGIMKSTAEYQQLHNSNLEAQQKLDVGNRDQAGAAGWSMAQADYDPGYANMFLEHQLADPKTDPQHKQMFQQTQQQLAQAPDDVSKKLIVKQMADSMVALSPKYTELQTAAQVARSRELAAQTGVQRLQAEMPGGPMANVDRTEMMSWQQQQQAAGKPSSPADFLAYKASLAPQAQVQAAAKAAGGMAPAALDNAAEQYWATGQMQGIPRGVAGMPISNAIRNRAAELHAGESLPEGTATYAANKKSLADLRSNTDQMEAFEGTGLKNLDLFLNKAAAIPDLGTKFANTPLRMITGKMIGTDAQASMEAARVTASKEVAKVLSSAKGSGVLSDSQSKEVDDILAGNLSLSAMKSVVGTLKQDMANRHSSYSSQIQDIQGRLGGKQGQQQATPAAPAKKTSGFDWSSAPTVQP